MSNIAIAKIPAKAGLEAKFKALECAEKAYYQGKGQTKQQVRCCPFIVIVCVKTRMRTACASIKNVYIYFYL